MSWFVGGLHRKFILVMSVGVLGVSLLFLFVFTAMYRGQLEQERSQASLHINRLLQASLENAMVKRDLDGLRAIVRRLGGQDSIRGVMILNPTGEVRFASHDPRLGQRLPEAGELIARLEGGEGESAAYSRFVIDADGHEVLRSVNAVRNKPVCTQCHGPLGGHPVNGVLIVDYDAETIRQQTGYGMLLLAASGGVVVVLMALISWWALRRFVLGPVAKLQVASRALSAGDLSARVGLGGGDELSELGATFNRMADTLQRSLAETREQRAFLQGLIDAIPDGIRVISSDFEVLMVNSAFSRQLGRSREEMIGQPCYRGSHDRADRCPATLVTCPVEELKGSGGAIKSLHQHYRGDGTSFHVEIYSSPMEVELEGARRTLIVESIRDLDELVRFSHEQRLSALGLLASGVAHEIHNPLASIRLALQSTVQLLSQPQVNRGEVSEYLQVVDAEIDRCIEITRRLLRISMPPGRVAHLLDLEAPIRETLSLLVAEARARNIVVEERLDPTRLRAMIDDGDLRMLLLNLVQNAYHAMPDGGRVGVATSLRDGWVELVIEDSGVGIRPEILPHVFEPFFSKRADGSSGSGLGLAICKSIVDRAGGRIEVSSKLGVGTRVAVFLPEVGEAREGGGLAEGLVAV